jgi:transcriptional regulator with XRE-family HTH domain
MVDRFENCLQASEGYLQVRAGLRQCPASVQKFILEMEEEGLKAPRASEERKRACAAIAAALMAHDPGEDSLVRAASRHAILVRFAEQLKMLRIKKGLTQVELAQRVGLRQSAISIMESAQCCPQRQTLVNLAKQLGVTPDALWPKAASGANGRRVRKQPGGTGMTGFARVKREVYSYTPANAVGARRWAAAWRGLGNFSKNSPRDGACASRLRREFRVA